MNCLCMLQLRVGSPTQEENKTSSDRSIPRTLRRMRWQNAEGSVDERQKYGIHVLCPPTITRIVE